MRTRRPRVFTTVQDSKRRVFAASLPKNIMEIIRNSTLKAEGGSAKAIDKNTKNPEVKDQLNAIRPNKCDNSKSSDGDLNNTSTSAGWSSANIKRESGGTESRNTKAYTNVCPIDGKVLDSITLILMVLHEFSLYFKAKLESGKISKIKEIEEISLNSIPCRSFYPRLFINVPLDFGSSKSFIYNEKIKGKTGSLIFYSSNFKYAVKVIRERELNCALQHIESFCKYYSLFPSTFVSKIVGIYSTPKLSFIVMDNVFKGTFDQIFDLKGKDLNRKHIGIGIENQWMSRKLAVDDRKCIVNAIRRDVEFLKSLNLMDYSFVIGINPYYDSEFRLYNEDGQVLEKLRSPDQATLGDQKCRFSVGIVDVLTEYTISKRIECVLQLLCCIGSKSSANPEEYARRFLDFIEHECFEEKSN